MEALGHSYNYVGKLFIPSWWVVAQSSMENPFYILSSWVLLLLFHFRTISNCSELNHAPMWAHKISLCCHKCSSNDPQSSRKWIRTLWEAADPFPIKAQDRLLWSKLCDWWALYGCCNLFATVFLNYIPASCFSFSGEGRTWA